MLCGSFNATAQTNPETSNAYTRQQDLREMQNNPLLKMSRSFIKSSGDQRKAFNLMILQEVAAYKLGDEKLQKEINKLKENRTYYEKLEKIKKKLSNAKISDTKNQEIMRILNDTGNRIYNLLGN